MKNGSLFDSYEEDTEIDEDAETIRDALDKADVDDINAEFEDEDDGNFEVYNEELFEDEEDELI